MNRAQEFAFMAETSITMARNKYIANNHKGKMLEQPFDALYDLFKGEAFELAEEMQESKRDYKKIGLEIDDCINFLMAMRVKCEYGYALDDVEGRR